jgi:hypothetical protein
VNVRFRVWLGDDRWLSEEEAAAALEELRGAEEIEGALVISGGQEEVVIEDALFPLALNLCFGALPELVEERSATVSLYASYGYVRLDPEGWWLRISGDGLPTVRVRRPDAYDALLACGERIAALLQLVGGPDHDAEARQLEAEAEKARRALASARREWGADPASGQASGS